MGKRFTMTYGKVLTTAALAAALTIGAVLPASAASLTEDNSYRIFGSDRYQTSLEVSWTGWDDGDAETVVVATGADFPDALAATPLASSHFAPLLLTKKDSLPVGFADELKRLGAKDVILVGGTGAISEKVQNQIKGLGIKVERISGKNRYETAVKIAEKVGMEEALFVTTGANFADSLSISPAAGHIEEPILLVPAIGAVPTVVADYIKANQPEFPFIIGGEKAVAPSVEKLFTEETIRLAGVSRYDTNQAINDFMYEIELYDESSDIYITTGTNFPDALSGSALASLWPDPLVLTAPTPTAASKQQIKDYSTNDTFHYILGGEKAVSSDTLKKLFAK